jgi:8-oxo-dGTP diphosphatase
VTRYCPRCGAALAAPPPTRCAGCGYELFVNARPTGGVVIVQDGRFLAVRRVREPSAGRWDLPSGFCDGWEHPADAAVREAREELGLTVALGQFIGMFVGGYRYQDEVLPVLDCFWLAQVTGGVLRPDPAEAAEAAWLPLDDPPPMAFDTMDRALSAATGLLAVPTDDISAGQTGH